MARFIKFPAKTGKLENSVVIGAPIFGKCTIIDNDAVVNRFQRQGNRESVISANKTVMLYPMA